VPAERPVAEYGVHGEQRHGYETDEEVGQGQAEQEVVADVLQLLVDLERHHDHYVAGHGDEAEHAGHERDEHGLGQREPGHDDADADAADTADTDAADAAADTGDTGDTADTDADDTDADDTADTDADDTADTDAAVDRRRHRRRRVRGRRGRRRRGHRRPRIVARRPGRRRRCGVQCRQRRPSRERVHCGAAIIRVSIVHAISLRPATSGARARYRPFCHRRRRPTPPPAT